MPWKIELSPDEKAIIVFMNSGPANVGSFQMVADANQALDEISSNPKYQNKPIVLTSSSKKIFSAGLDLSILNDSDKLKRLLTVFEKTIFRIWTFPRWEK